MLERHGITMENTREIVLDTLLTLEKENGFSHVMIRSVLDKYIYQESLRGNHREKNRAGLLSECVFQGAGFKNETPYPKSPSYECLPAFIYGQYTGQCRVQSGLQACR